MKKYLLYTLLIMFLSINLNGQKNNSCETTFSYEQMIDELNHLEFMKQYKECLSRERQSIKKNQQKLDDYDEISPFFFDRALITLKDKRCAFVDTNLNIIKFLDICSWSPINQAKAVVVKNNAYWIMDTSGRLLNRLMYKRVDQFKNGLATVEENGKFGFIDISGNKVIAAKFDVSRGFRTPGIAIVKVNGRYGAIDRTGNFKIQPVYDELGFQDTNLMRAKLNGKSGYIDNNGKIVIALKHAAYLSFLTGDFIYGSLNDKVGVYNKFGSIVLPFQYEEVKMFRNGRFIIKINNKYGMVNDRGQTVLTPSFDDLYFLSDELLAAKNNGKYGVIDLSGKASIPFDYSKIYEDASPVHKWLEVEKDGKEMFINYKNEIQLFPGAGKYYNVGNFTNEMAIVSMSSEWGVINRQGKELFLKKCHSLQLAGPNRFLMVDDSTLQMSFVDSNGRQITSRKYDNAGFFSREYQQAEVKLNEKYGLVDLMGREILPCEWDYIGAIPGFIGFRAVKKNGKYGLVNAKGEIAAHPVYDKIVIGDAQRFDANPGFSTPVIWMYKDNKVFLIDKCGNIAEQL